MVAESGADFQARAVSEGQTAQMIADKILRGCGFTIVERNHEHPTSGVTINFIADDPKGRRWYFDVVGSFTSERAGLLRTDSVWKALGRATALAHTGVSPVVVLTTNLPADSSVGDRALRTCVGDTLFDVVEMVSSAGKARLRAYAKAESLNRPLPGFWTAGDVYGETSINPTMGASVSIPVDRLTDSFGLPSVEGNVDALPHWIRVYVPSVKATGQQVSEGVRARVLEEIKVELGKQGGGFTTLEARGGWVDPAQGIVYEDVSMLEAHQTNPVPPETVLSFAAKILSSMEQQAVAISIDGVMYIFR